MRRVMFHDFDEAHRAEKAKRMKEYNSYFVPLTGSPYDRVPQLNIPFKDYPELRLYYHPERPFFVYLLMIASISMFGATELTYRLPSFILGMSVFFVYVFFAIKQSKKVPILALSTGMLMLMTSYDLWLSSQYAQLDTGLTVFLFASLLSLITYCEKRRLPFLIISGISFALAVLSKGQPAVIFAFPLCALFLLKKLSRKEILIFIASASTLLVPWVLALLILLKIELSEFLRIFFGFGFDSTQRNIHHEAPIFWYSRWFWESLRPGWTLFLIFLTFDIFKGSLSWKKKTLLSYILGSFLIFSLQTNKIWWYVLPIVPSLAFYIFLSTSDYLQRYPKRLVALAFVIFLSSLPIFLKASNTTVMVYGFIITILSVLLLINDKLPKLALLVKKKEVLFITSVTLSLAFFYTHFPKIVPYHKETKAVASYFATIHEEKKCLWIYDMPTEAALFYSNAGEIKALNFEETKTQLFLECDKYLITAAEITDPEFWYLPKKELLFQKGKIKLIKLY